MLILSTPYFISRYLFSNPAKNTPPGTEVNIYTLEKKPPKIKEWLTCHRLLPRPDRFYRPDYIAGLKKQAEKTDKILLFGLERLKDIMILRRIFPKHKMALFFWNPVCSMRDNKAKAYLYVKHLRLLGVQPVTFDPKDAAQYGMKLVNQTFLLDDKALHPAQGDTVGDLFMVCDDKNRAPRLAGFYQRLTRSGVKANFYIVKSKHTVPVPGMEHLYHDEYLPYERTLQLVSQHKAYIEILQDGQKGMTLRALEALSVGRKLITDNKDIVNWELYHPSRIMVVDYDKTPVDEIRRFIDSPYVPPTAQQLEPYNLPVWLVNMQRMLWGDDK